MPKLPLSIATPPDIEIALERFRLASEADTQWREKSLEDLKFSVGDQWPLDAVNIRRGRPCLTMDQIQQSVRLVSNQYRQQPPAITVDPVGSGADQDTAEIIQGLIRHVEVNCEAQTVYEQTHEGVVRTGFDSLRLLTVYADEKGDDQEIIIEKIRNQFSVYWQPGVPQEKAKWCFIVVDLPHDTYKSEYGDSALAKRIGPEGAAFTAIGNAAPSWMNEQYIRVAEYFTIEEKKLKSGRTKKKVKWQKINAVEELDSKNLPGTSIPVFTAYGDDIDVNGERHVAGLVRNAKDPQRMYNYQCSAATEVLALARRAPIMAVEGQLSGREKMWEDNNALVLQYKSVDISGKPAPPPTFLTTEPPIQGITLMIRQASLDLKAAMGIYDPSLGQRRGDESGSAIEKLQSQGNIATLNYADNVSRMMKRLGRSLLEWIPFYYDEAKVRRIINPDGTVKQVVVHAGEDQAEAAQLLAEENDIKQIYDVGTGKYDVVISVGPTYQSKRQQAVSTQLELLKSLPPQMVPNFVDLVVRNMDIPQADEFADRAKKMLPPQLQDGDEDDPATQVNKLQSQLMQMGQQHQQLVQALEHSNDIIKTKQVEQQGRVSIEQNKGQTDITIEKMKIEAQVAIAEITTRAQNAIERQQIYNEIWKELHGSAHDLAMQKDKQSHEQQMGTQQAAQAQQEQSQDQAHQVGMSAMGTAADQQSQAADQAHQSDMAQQAQESQGDQ